MNEKILIIDDDEPLAKCLALSLKKSGHLSEVFANAIEAMQWIDENGAPKMIFLDILLDGPDGFTLLNELVSYPDTAKIPIVIVTSLFLSHLDLRSYGIVGILNKETMRPEDIAAYANRN